MSERRHGIACWVVAAGLALAACEGGPVAEVGPDNLILASGGDTLFIASRGRPLAGVYRGQSVIDALRGNELTRVFVREVSAEDRGFAALVATPSGEAYFSIGGESQIARWDGVELTWIEMPGTTRLAAYDESVWAHSRDGGDVVLSRVEGGTVVEVRREAYELRVGLVRVLPSGHAVWRTGVDAAQEVDETGAVVGSVAVGEQVLGWEGVTVTVEQREGEVDASAGFTVTFAPDGRPAVTETFQGTFVGAVAGTPDGIDWALTRWVVIGALDNGDPAHGRQICVLHFDGTVSTERFCTGPRGLYGPAIIHAGAVFYADDGRIHEVPLR